MDDIHNNDDDYAADDDCYGDDNAASMHCGPLCSLLGRLENLLLC